MKPRAWLAIVVIAATLSGSSRALESARFGGGGRGDYLILGQYPEARGTIWAGKGGIRGAAKTLDLLVAQISRDDAEALAAVAAKGVRVRLVVGRGGEVARDGAAARAVARDSAGQGATEDHERAKRGSPDRGSLEERQAATLAELARAGVAVALHDGSELAAGYAIIDGSALVIPAPVLGGRAVVTQAAVVRDATIARAFTKHHERLVSESESLVPAPGVEPRARGWKSLPPVPILSPAGGTYHLGPRGAQPTDVHAVFGFDDLDRAMGAAPTEDAAHAGESPPTLYLHVGPSVGDEDRFARWLEVLRRRYVESIRRVVVVYDPDVPRPRLESWIAQFLGSRDAEVMLHRSNHAVASSFLFTHHGPWERGIALIGAPECGIVVRGLTPGAHGFVEDTP